VVRTVRAIFLQRFLADPTELNFFALMGVLAGTLAPSETGAKDSRTYGATDGFPLLRQWFDAMPRDASRGTWEWIRAIGG
jgi:hypothetical protein